jgi:hypothetical protein
MKRVKQVNQRWKRHLYWHQGDTEAHWWLIRTATCQQVGKPSRNV